MKPTLRLPARKTNGASMPSKFLKDYTFGSLIEDDQIGDGQTVQDIIAKQNQFTMTRLSGAYSAYQDHAEFANAWRCIAEVGPAVQLSIQLLEPSDSFMDRIYNPGVEPASWELLNRGVVMCHSYDDVNGLTCVIIQIGGQVRYHRRLGEKHLPIQDKTPAERRFFNRFNGSTAGRRIIFQNC